MLYVQFWDIKSFSFLSVDAWTGVTLFYVIAISFYYGFFSKRRKLISRNSAAPILWIFVAFFISMLSVSFFYNQKIAVTLFAYKYQYLMFGGISLLIISPTKKEIYDSLQYFAMGLTAAYLLRIAIPSLFSLTDAQERYDDTDITVAGYSMIVLFLYWNLQEYKATLNTKSFIKIIWLFAVLIAMQNRSSLFPAVLCGLYVFLNVKSKYKPFVVIALSMIVCFVALQTFDIWSNLYDQTISEMGDPSYNRNKAFYYYIFRGSDNLFKVLFGNGIISTHTINLIDRLKDAGIYNSDMGFIGYWNEFGIIPIIVFVWMIVKTFRGKQYPLFMKLYAFQMVACSWTIMYFGVASHLITFLVFFYLFEGYSIEGKNHEAARRYMNQQNAGVRPGISML